MGFPHQTKSVEHIWSEYPGCVGVQGKNEEVPRVLTQGFLGTNIEKSIILQLICLGICLESDQNNLVFNNMDLIGYDLTM